jgi:hypothetical protein
MSVIVLRYSLYNLKNLERGRYGPFRRLALLGARPRSQKMRLTQGA